MKLIILIRGPICAGKSTIVNLLSKNLKNASCIDFDAFKRAVDRSKATQWRDKMAFKSAIYLCEMIMKKKRTIIADIHSSKKYQYLKYKDLANKNNYKLYSILILPPLAVCLKRNSTRKIKKVLYKISDKEISDYWKNTFKIKKEIVFDTSKIKPQKIIKFILENVNN